MTMDLEEIERMRDEKDFMMRNEGAYPFSGQYGEDPNSDEVTPYPY